MAITTKTFYGVIFPWLMYFFYVLNDIALNGPNKEGPIDTSHDYIEIKHDATHDYRMKYYQVNQYLIAQYPQLQHHIYGTLYEETNGVITIAKYLAAIKELPIYLTILGEDLFELMELNTFIIKKLQSNPFIMIILYCLIGEIADYIRSYGAFEVIYNGQVVFSKLADDRWPSLEEFGELLKAYVPNTPVGSG